MYLVNKDACDKVVANDGYAKSQYFNRSGGSPPFPSSEGSQIKHFSKNEDSFAVHNILIMANANARHNSMVVVYVYFPSYLNTSIHTYVGVYIIIYIYIYIYIYSYTCMYVYMCMYVHIYVHLYINIYICICICTHIHTHT